MPGQDHNVGSHAGSRDATQPIGVDMKLARERAKKLRLMEYERDSRGVTIPGNEQLFSLFANPRNVGAENPGIGLYFHTVLMVALLLVALAALNMYPLIDNLSQDRYTEYFQLQDDRGVDFAQYPTCPRPYKADNKLTRSSYGAHCSSNRTNSHFTCPAACVVKLGDDVVFSRRADLARPEDKDKICAAITPGDPDKTPAEDFVMTMQAFPKHCTLENDVYSLGAVPVGHFWMLDVGLVVILCWFVALKRGQMTSAQQINASVISVADYAVYVRNTGFETVARKDLEEFFSHYGEVAVACFTVSVGKYMRMEERLRQLKLKRDELDAMCLNPHKNAGLVGLVYKLLLAWSCNVQGVLHSTEQAIQALEHDISLLQADDLLPTGDAIITFNYEAHANNVFKDHGVNLLDAVKAKVFCQRTAPAFKGHRISVERPPEPSDMLWENTDVYGVSVTLRRAASALIICGILLVGFRLQTLIELEKNAARTQIQDMYEESKSFRSALGSEKDLQLQSLSAAAAVVVVVINLIITFVLRSLNDMERYRTRSDMETMSIYKLTVAQILNTVIIPVLVHNDPSDWYLRGGLADQAFFIQVTNAVLPEMMFILQALNLPQYIFAKHVHTQACADAMAILPEPLVAERYASVLKSILLALLYSPMIPVSYIVGLVGIIFTYWGDKYVFLRLMRRPRELDHRLMGAFNNVLLWVLPVQLLVAFMRFFRDEPTAALPMWFGLAIWGVFLCAPLKWIGVHVLEDNLLDAGTGNKPWAECMRREDANNQAVGREHGTLEVYAPPAPLLAPEPYQRRVRDTYVIPSTLSTPIPELLPGQSPETGGENTRPPAPAAPCAPVSSYGAEAQQQQQQQPQQHRQPQQHYHHQYQHQYQQHQQQYQQQYAQPSAPMQSMQGPHAQYPVPDDAQRHSPYPPQHQYPEFLHNPDYPGALPRF